MLRYGLINPFQVPSNIAIPSVEVTLRIVDSSSAESMYCFGQIKGFAVSDLFMFEWMGSVSCITQQYI